MPYTEAYESALLRGDQDPPPWQLHDEIAALARRDDWLLDIGCGTMRKTLRLAPLVAGVVGVEPAQRMRRQAWVNIHATEDASAVVLDGTAQSLPFEDETFDLVTVMMAPHDTAEIARVVRPGGRVVCEKLGERDKANIKLAFGDDEHGPRGQLAELAPGERAAQFEQEFRAHFGHVDIREGWWATYYTREGLELLLEQTPTIRSYDREADRATVDRVCAQWATDRGVVTAQHRLLIRAWK